MPPAPRPVLRDRRVLRSIVGSVPAALPLDRARPFQGQPGPEARAFHNKGPLPQDPAPAPGSAPAVLGPSRTPLAGSSDHPGSKHVDPPLGASPPPPGGPMPPPLSGAPRR